MPRFYLAVLLYCTLATFQSHAANLVFKAGDNSLQKWILNDPPVPKDNALTDKRIALGKQLFFDPRLSGDGNMSCGTCHNPLFGWSDGLPTAKGFKSQVLSRATPTIINTAYNTLQMWDGRKKSLEDQALGPMLSAVEMNIDLAEAVDFLKQSKGYKKAFADAYPGEGINDAVLAKAIASFERTVLSRNSRFDQWVAGEPKALSKLEILGFKVFVDPEKGNCEVCHSAPNFTDNGFHNIGLQSYNTELPDMGRYAIKPIGILKGAFKTPTLRDVEFTAPYFHDGSAATLEDVVAHYVEGGASNKDLDPNMKKLKLTKKEKKALVAFMKALSSPRETFELPQIPLD